MQHFLHHPNSEVKIIVYTDSSEHVIGAVINQIEISENSQKVIQPLSHYSEKLTPAQAKWSTYDRELYAIYAAVKKIDTAG